MALVMKLVRSEIPLISLRAGRSTHHVLEWSGNAFLLRSNFRDS